MGLFQPRAIDFLLFLAFAPTALTLACTFFVNFVPFMQAREAAASRKFMFAIQVSFFSSSSLGREVASWRHFMLAAQVGCMQQGIDRVWFLLPV